VFLCVAAIIALRAANTRGDAMPDMEVDVVTIGAEPQPLPISEIA
jgi:hypothetical protein